ncbi:Prolipoprotein diacylglyceryl transferase [Lacunisphaera limnophila]|uniref:Phosphatidylglycerol--prolipoprotein diacylglyceryl transferase n=1 Tax=Lacunisphaera limnophila TaxID=1838286 RepID=A0A1D8AXG0_9BACT|nr:prolipoprotein diacylglyceryl transferase [Lacunisphaera limnophila]AOS45578.1 Prolipoprotein diacylglyceryl transferase [Lacunisphaera limnophila]
MLGWPVIAQWVHTPHPFLIRFGEGFGLRYYGLAYLLGFVAAAWLLHRYERAGRSPFALPAISDLMTYLIAGVLLGGRLGYFLLYQPGTLLTEPLAFFRVWEGGMASHGGFLGVVVALILFARRSQTSFFLLSDLIVSTGALGLGLGRLANYLNGELWGKATDVPWAVIFLQTGGGNVPRHPSQLYEAALEGFLLFAYLQWRFWRSPAVRTQPGRLTGEFLLAYALARVVCEAFREPDAGLILGLSRGMFYSLFMAVSGLAIIATRGRSQGKT